MNDFNFFWSVFIEKGKAAFKKNLLPVLILFFVSSISLVIVFSENNLYDLEIEDFTIKQKLSDLRSTPLCDEYNYTIKQIDYFSKVKETLSNIDMDLYNSTLDAGLLNEINSINEDILLENIRFEGRTFIINGVAPKLDDIAQFEKALKNLNKFSSLVVIKISISPKESNYNFEIRAVLD